MALYENNDGLAELTGLADANGDAVADAQVTATLTRGEEVVWSGTLAPVAGSPGSYSAAVPDALELTLGEVLLWTFTAVSGSLQATYYKKERVKRRWA